MISPLLRWFISTGTLNVPQAAGPVAFSLIALDVTGNPDGGAAMMLAMTLAQVCGAIPIARAGRHMPVAKFLRLLVAIRSVALLAIAVCAGREVSFGLLVVLAAVAGLVNGAAHGYLRALLGHLVQASRWPRALGIAATLNEVTFVLAPVAAAGLGSISPAFGLFVLAAVGAVPALLVPGTAALPVEARQGAMGSLLSPPILLWLGCAAAGGAAIAAIETGSVALALSFGYEPTLAIVFTVPLCLASVAGGIWVSARNRAASRGVVLAQLLVMTLGALLTALEWSVAATIFGAVLMGGVIAPLATHYSLTLDALAPPQRKPEMFALLRTANAVGVILASALLTLVSLHVTLIAVAAFVAIATLLVGVAYRRNGRGEGQ